MQPGSVANRKKAENQQEKQNPGSIDLQCPGESKRRDSVSRRNLNPRTVPLERSHCLFRLIRSPLFAFSDAPPGRRSARSPTTFGSRSKDIVSFSGYYHLFPGISAYFQTVLNWTFGVFLQFYRFNHPLQPTGLQHDRTALFYIPSATHFASSTFRSSLAFNSSSTLTISG